MKKTTKDNVFIFRRIIEARRPGKPKEIILDIKIRATVKKARFEEWKINDLEKMKKKFGDKIIVYYGYLTKDKTHEAIQTNTVHGNKV